MRAGYNANGFTAAIEAGQTSFAWNRKNGIDIRLSTAAIEYPVPESRLILPCVHPHRLRHTWATLLVLAGMDTMLTKRVVRIRSDRVFGRYSDPALDIKMEEKFDELYGLLVNSE